MPERLARFEHVDHLGLVHELDRPGADDVQVPGGGAVLDEHQVALGVRPLDDGRRGLLELVLGQRIERREAAQECGGAGYHGIGLRSDAAMRRS